MRPRSRRLANPIEFRIELALRPGEFIGDRACFSFVSGLDAIVAEVRALTGSDPARAAALCEAFLAGCHQEAEELDDSSGSFGQFVQDLICLWIKARQGSGAVANTTASTLLAWVDDDPYAFCQIEKDAAAAFNRAGLAAFEKQVRVRFEAVSGEPSGYPYSGGEPCAKCAPSAHHRKTRFILEFESVAASATCAEKPSSLERAKARWGERHRGGRS